MPENLMQFVTETNENWSEEEKQHFSELALAHEKYYFGEFDTGFNTWYLYKRLNGRYEARRLSYTLLGHWADTLDELEEKLLRYWKNF